MRRTVINSGHLSQLETGVIASVVIREFKAHKPVVCNSVLCGSGPKSSVIIPIIKSSAPENSTRNIKGLMPNLTKGRDLRSLVKKLTLEISFQIHATVKTSYLICVTIEGQGLNSFDS